MSYMTSWNHRFVQVERNGETEVGLYEVYYNEAGQPISRTEEPATIVGDTKREAWNALAVAQRAIGQPVLTDAEIGINR